MRHPKVPGIRTAIAVFVAAAVVGLGGASQAKDAPSSASAPYEEGTVIVGFLPGTPRSEVAESARSVRGREREEIGPTTHLFEVEPGTELEAIETLSARDRVRYAELNYLVFPTADPVDPLYSQLWGLKNTGQAVLPSPSDLFEPLPKAGRPDADIDAELAWDITTGSSSIVVGVVDTGVDYTHSDLLLNMWMNDGTVNGCPIGTHGFDAIFNTCDSMDTDTHGTHVAGTIGARGNNALGVTGVNWSVQIMSLRFLLSQLGGTTADAIQAINWAVDAKISGVNLRVLNNSWGGGGFSIGLLDAINRAGTNGILFVAAAGNNSRNVDESPFFYPCAYAATNVICVAASDQLDELAWFSNFGTGNVDLAAPGDRTLSTALGNSYAYLAGTSMAAPHVSGAAALVLSECTLTTSHLKSNLLNSVDEVVSLNGLVASNGRLNVNNAIRTCGGVVGNQPPIASFTVTFPGKNGGSTGNFDGSASSDPDGTIVSYSWSFGDGSSATGVKVSHTYTAAGTYTAILTVTDDDGATASESKIITCSRKGKALRCSG